MPLNKFYSSLRNEFERSNPNYSLETILRTANLCGLLNLEEKNQFLNASATKGPDAPQENFVVNAVFNTIHLLRWSDMLIAKNFNGDVVVEEVSSQNVLSISGSGKNMFQTTCNDKLKCLEMYIAYRLAVDELDTHNIDALAQFCIDIKKEIKELPSESFVDKSGDLNYLDFTLNLPRTQNLVAYKKISFDDVNEEDFVFGVPSGKDFKNVTVQDAPKEINIDKTFEKIESFNVTPDRVFSDIEMKMLAQNEENSKNFIASPECQDYLEDYYDLYKANLTPHSVAFYGPSGTGKSVTAQVIAQKLNRPFVAYKMRENSDEDSLRGTIKSVNGKDGNIEYEDSNIVKALKNGWVCEVQELSACTNQGAETFFNPILDKTRTFEDAAGKMFTVHPDALIVFTYNPTYCENNQIATSLLNRIDDTYRIDFPTAETFASIVKSETGFEDFEILSTIYKLCFGDGSEIGSIRKILENYDVEEEISLRQVCAWVNRYKNCRRYYGQPTGWLDAAEHTIIQSVGQREPEVQADIRFLIEAVL